MSKNNGYFEKDNNSLITYSYDHFIDEKVGFGKYQIMTVFLILLNILATSSEIIAISFLNLILKIEWQLSPSEMNILNSAFFLGSIIGSIICGPLGDIYGRKKPYLLSFSFFIVCQVGIAFSQNFIFYCILRCIFGIILGFVMTFSSTYISESLPPNIRGKGMMLFGISYSLGAQYACLIAFLVLDSIERGNWRALVLLTCLLSIISSTICFFFLQESPRYLVTAGKKEEFKTVLPIIMRQNKKSIDEVSEDEIDRLFVWAEDQRNFRGGSFGNPALLFSKKLKLITPLIWTLWFIGMVCYYGIIFHLPETMEKIDEELNIKDQQKQDFGSIYLSTLTELPSNILCFFIIERKFFGRKNTILINFIFCGISCALTYLVFTIWESKEMFIVFSTAARFFISNVSSINATFALENYPTNLRVTGLGIAAAIGNLGGAASSWIASTGFYIGTTGSFLELSIASLLGAIACWLIPYDTTGVELDKDL